MDRFVHCIQCKYCTHASHYSFGNDIHCNSFHESRKANDFCGDFELPEAEKPLANQDPLRWREDGSYIISLENNAPMRAALWRERERRINAVAIKKKEAAQRLQEKNDLANIIVLGGILLFTSVVAIAVLSLLS